MSLGDELGLVVGLALGLKVGRAIGLGTRDGLALGLELGICDGDPVGLGYTQASIPAVAQPVPGAAARRPGGQTAHKLHLHGLLLSAPGQSSRSTWY